MKFRFNIFKMYRVYVILYTRYRNKKLEVVYMTETMGQIIKRLRKEHNLTQEELAEQLNISAQLFPNGKTIPACLTFHR